ncbi:hypothetical protein ACFYVL_21070 [Streptomyces sp. NPDC004111]|uniref:hypothetical protein n=1 Tax=Streptomyces sp. NPDC004111 TaxID=3364690 RepID=UPI00367D0D91
MESGRPVEVSSTLTSWKKLSRLAFVAQQFGYEYADVRQGGGPQGHGMVLLIVPDPTPEGRARAARNRERYPDAADGSALPPYAPEEVRILKARMMFDLATRTTPEQAAALMALFLTVTALAIGYRFRGSTTAVLATAIGWAVLMALLPVATAASRRWRAKHAAKLEAAGLVAVTGPQGRVRYLPPGARLPGHGNPFGDGSPPPPAHPGAH